ncbi:MAG: methylenetetrahydrofolate reductase [Planctomycetota bacterium]
MKLIRDIYASRRANHKPIISFEFFPPKTAEGESLFLKKTLPSLVKLRPDFCSVTCGAGGSTREKTLMITDYIQREHALTAVHHLTCMMSTGSQLSEILSEATRLDIRNILALRGDPPRDSACDFTSGCGFARELIALIHNHGEFCVGAAGFPEGHIACKAGKYADWAHLKEKIDTGVDFVLTQLFFDNTLFYEFYEHLTQKLGVTIPVVPGIMPIMSAAQIQHISQLCAVHWPAPLLARIHELADNEQALMDFGIEYATRQCEELLKYGVPGLHLYTLNKLRPSQEIIKNLNF